jgi:DinB superfamily
MSERAEQLAAQLDTELTRMVEFLCGLTESQIDAPCKDPQGDTIRHVLAHLREGTDQVVAWARNASGAGHGHSHSHSGDRPTADLQQTVAVLRDGQETIVAAVRRLTDEQLDAVPPASPGLADGATPVHRIVAFIAEDVAGHLGHLRTAVEDGAGVSRAVA